MDVAGAVGREDLSPYLVHLTRDYGGMMARENLLSIVAGWEIQARNVHGAARLFADHGLASSKLQSVCMSEAPLGALRRLCAPLPGRQVKLAPYGVILRRPILVDQGANPVWYTNMSPAAPGDWLIRHVEHLIQVALHDYSLRFVEEEVVSVPIEDSPIFALAPFVEWVVPGTKDFTWEREWRLVRDVHVGMDALAGIVAPEWDHSDLRGALTAAYNARGHAEHGAPLVAPDWAPERIDEALATVGS